MTTYYQFQETVVAEVVRQAKAMEKEQRIKDYNAGYDDAQCNHINDAENYTNESDYINKTYNNGNSNTNI